MIFILIENVLDNNDDVINGDGEEIIQGYNIHVIESIKTLLSNMFSTNTVKVVGILY